MNDDGNIFVRTFPNSSKKWPYILHYILCRISILGRCPHRIFSPFLTTSTKKSVTYIEITFPKSFPPAVFSACAMLGWKGGGGGARKPKREIFISFLVLVLSSSLALVGLASATLYNNDDLEDQEMHWEFETPWGEFPTKFITFYLPHFYKNY